MSKREAVIVGVADLPLKDGKVAVPMSVLQAQALCARDALADAGIPMHAVDGLLTAGMWGVPGPGQLATVTLSEYLGIAPRFVDGTNIGGSAFEAHAVEFGVAAVRAEAALMWLGAGRPDNAYLIERLVEQAARETGIDRLELRRRNFIPKDAFPYKTPTMIPYDSGDYEALMNEAVERAEWKTFESRREEARKRGKLRGIGLAVFIEPAGAGGPPKDQAMLKFGSSGELEIFSVTGPAAIA